jgi:hypothetical protein
MTSAASSLDAIRHRLLEGVLLRLARLPNAGDLVLRGGMLMRQWFRPFPRSAGDLDLVATFPFGALEAATRFLPVLADETVPDGVAFEPDRARVEGIWLDTSTPGVRVFASGMAGGAEADFHVDITFAVQLRPAPVLGEIATTCGQVARVWTCRPETILAQKVQALWHYGVLSWRPKDLHDLRLLLAHVAMDPVEARGAIGASFATLGGTGDDARGLFAPSSWWGMKMSSARWHDFVKTPQGRHAPRDLETVVAEVAVRLAPILEGLP